MRVRAIDGYAWRIDDGRTICRVWIGGAWWFELWPARRRGERVTLDRLPRCLGRWPTLAEAVDAASPAVRPGAGPSGQSPSKGLGGAESL